MGRSLVGELGAERASMSPATVKRLITQPPIVRTHTLVDGVRAVLLRLGEPGPNTPRELANIMGASPGSSATIRLPEGMDI